MAKEIVYRLKNGSTIQCISSKDTTRPKKISVETGVIWDEGIEMSKGINVLDDTVLVQFLGADGVEELRSKIIDMIVEEIHDQLRESSSYIISPDDIAGALYNDMVEEIKLEVIAEYKEKVAEAVQKKMEKIGF